jgi:hypothetical protein
MGTYHDIRPVGDDDFGDYTYICRYRRKLTRTVFTSRSATAVDASTFLCYRYRHSDQSIFGLVLDRRERSEAFINILKTLDTNTGLPLLPGLAMALFGLRVNIRTIVNLENTYYINKMLDRITLGIGSGSSRPAHFGSLVQMLSAMFNGLYSVVGSLNVSMSATLALTKFIREKDAGKQFSDFVEVIDSETRGHIEAAARTQARIGQRQHIFTAAMQTTIALQAHDATAASTKTLGTVQELLAGTQELNRKTEEVSRNAADYGTLVLYITFATLLAGGLSTCAVSSELLRSVLRLDVTDINHRKCSQCGNGRHTSASSPWQ